MLRKKLIIGLCVTLVGALSLTALLMAFSGGPDPRLTGGFEEDTCQQCHKDFALN